jgi:hypothetical protein
MPIYQKNTWWDKKKKKEKIELQHQIKEAKKHLERRQKELEKEKE